MRERVLVILLVVLTLLAIWAFIWGPGLVPIMQTLY